MVAQTQYVIALITIGLFSIAIMGFAVNFADDNNAPISIADDPELTTLRTDVDANLDEYRSGSQSTYQSIIESSIDTGETTPSGGQFAITPVSAVPVTKNIIKTGYIKIFGSGGGFGIFMTTFISIILFVMAMTVWKSWIGRSPT